VKDAEIVVSRGEMAANLDRIGAHVELANAWAQQRFRLFPQIDSISVDLGANFGLLFTVSLTWNRKHEPRTTTSDHP
jgi:hypothetical protein